MEIILKCLYLYTLFHNYRTEYNNIIALRNFVYTTKRLNCLFFVCFTIGYLPSVCKANKYRKAFIPSILYNFKLENIYKNKTKINIITKTYVQNVSKEV